MTNDRKIRSTKRNSKMYRKKRRRQLYRDGQTFGIIALTVVALFTVGAILIGLGDKNRKTIANKESAVINEEGEASVITANSEETSDVETTLETEYNGLVKDSNPKIKVLLQEYFDAKNKSDVSKLSNIVDVLPDTIKDDLAREKKIIESYSNIEVYTKDGLQEGSYVVYAYYEVKFIKIDTPAPSSVVFYVQKKAGSEELQIHTWSKDSGIVEYINKLNEEDTEVKTFLDDVEKKLKKACKKDSSLKALVKELEGK